MSNKSELLAEKLAKLTNKTAKVKESEADELASIYTLQPASELAHLRHEAPPRKIFGTMFFEGEISYLFAPPARGKSVLAVQLADAISRGTNCLGFPNETGPQLVAFFDFEMSNKQFVERYISSTDRNNFYQFHSNFLRAEVTHPKAKSAKEGAKKLLSAMKVVLAKSNAKVIIIDNLTRIAGDISEGGAAFEVVTYLDQLKKEGYSILLIGHAKKGDFAKFGIDENDALGSSMVSNFIDGSFALGCNTINKSVKYLKQIKCRSGIASADVIILETEKKNDNFLQLTYKGLANEKDQLKSIDPEDQQKMESEVISLSRAGYSLNRIAKEINESQEYKGAKIYPTTVSRIMAREEARIKQEEFERTEQAAEDGETDGDQFPPIFNY